MENTLLDPFALLSTLPAFLTVKHEPSGMVWQNAMPRLTMVGSTIWLSYGVGEMEYVLYERAEDFEELVAAIEDWAFQLLLKDEIVVKSVFVGGKSM